METITVNALKKLHYQDAILVLNINDYLREHSKEEIKYFSNNLNKPIYYLSDIFKNENKIKFDYKSKI
ncbi:MAG: hypothetical protein ACFFA2_09705 [Promethearchaeota archaeon]